MAILEQWAIGGSRGRRLTVDKYRAAGKTSVRRLHGKLVFELSGERTNCAADGCEWTRGFEKENVALLKADWTSHDDAISQVLTSLGRSGVPAYVLYSPSAMRLQSCCLKYSRPGIVMDALEKIARIQVRQQAGLKPTWADNYRLFADMAAILISRLAWSRRSLAFAACPCISKSLDF